MGSVSSVELGATPQRNYTRYIIKTFLPFPEGDHLSLSLHPVYDVLTSHLREPSLSLSREEAERLGLYEARKGEGYYSTIYDVSDLGRAIEAKCQRGKTLTIAEDPHFYTPRFGGEEQDEINFRIYPFVPCYSCHTDEVDLAIVDNELTLTLEPLFACQRAAQGESGCGFMMTLLMYGANDYARQTAATIQDTLAEAYLS